MVCSRRFQEFAQRTFNLSTVIKYWTKTNKDKVQAPSLNKVLLVLLILKNVDTFVTLKSNFDYLECEQLMQVLAEPIKISFEDSFVHVRVDIAYLKNVNTFITLKSNFDYLACEQLMQILLHACEQLMQIPTEPIKISFEGFLLHVRVHNTSLFRRCSFPFVLCMYCSFASLCPSIAGQIEDNAYSNYIKEKTYKNTSPTSPKRYLHPLTCILVHLYISNNCLELNKKRQGSAVPVKIKELETRWVSKV